MFNILKSAVFELLFGFSRLVNRAPRERKAIYVVAPTSAGSLGDQALIQGLSDGLTGAVGQSPMVEILVEKGQKPQVLKTGFLPTISFNGNSRVAQFLFSLRLKQAKALVILGADTLDGSYALEKNLAWFDLADLCASLNIPVSIVSFSFSEDPVPKAVSRIKRMHPAVEFRSRDPLSRIRFEKATGRCCELTADLAFLMQPGDHASIAVLEWVADKREAGFVIAGLNVNQLGLQYSRSELLRSYAEALTRFLEEHSDAAVLMVPHDFREGQSDQEIMLDIKNELHPTLSERVLLASGPYESWEAKRIIAEADFLITGRMHLAIAAMSQGVPAFGLAYKDKFEGLMQHFALKGNLLDREKALQPELLLGFMKVALSDHMAVRQVIERELSAVRLKSLGNLEKLC